MDLNHIKLPAALIADLYQSSIVDTNETSASGNPNINSNKKPTIDIDWKYIGNNGKNILIIIKYDNAIHLPDEQLSFLTNMLSACKIGLDDAAIINLNNYPDTSYKKVLDHFNSKIVFLYGIEPASLGLPISFPHFQVQSFANCTFLFVPTLDELEKDKVLKSKLWVCLRRIFGI